MIVKQIYVGWYGVKLNKTVVNATIAYTACTLESNQLEKAYPSKKETERLLKAIKKNHPWATDHINELEIYLANL